MSRIERYVDGLTLEQFRADDKTIDAVVRNLEVIGEAVRHLVASQEQLPSGVPWSDIAGIRNILVHEYFGVDLGILWRTVTDDLPSLRPVLEDLLR